MRTRRKLHRRTRKKRRQTRNTGRRKQRGGFTYKIAPPLTHDYKTFKYERYKTFEYKRYNIYDITDDFNKKLLNKNYHCNNDTTFTYNIQMYKVDKSRLDNWANSILIPLSGNPGSPSEESERHPQKRNDQRNGQSVLSGRDRLKT